MSSLNEEGFRCECPSGMIGDGIGTEGCYHSNVTLCRSDTCYNQGTCQVKISSLSEIKPKYKEICSSISKLFRIFYKIL